MATTGAPAAARSPWKAVIGGSVGNMIEWYDWFVYSTFSVYFASAFFPEGNPTAQLLNTAGIFAVGFFMRPVGGWLLGRIGDRKGRKAALTTTVTLMSLSAILIAIAPTYAQVGYFGAAVLLIGLALQIALQHTMSEGTLSSWGWRVPFVVRAIGAAGIFWLRRNLLETEAFEELEEDDATKAKRGTIRGLLDYKREFAMIIAFSMGGTLCDYTYSTYMTKYLSNTAGMSKNDAALVSFCAIAVMLLLVPLAGALSDRIGRRPLLITFGVGATLGTVPLMTALGNVSTFGGALLLMLAGIVIITGYTSISGVVKAELFPAHVRALGVALPYAIANALFGGSAEYVALWFKDAGVESGFYWYVSACAAISLVVYVAMRETRDVVFSQAEKTTGIREQGVAA